MKLPTWIDEQLSNELHILRSRGEGQHLEFKEKFPQNAQDLAKEIAAFATSNQGTILVGVSDNGDLVGIAGAEQQKERDSILKRLGGICSGTVKPAITPTAKFARENDLVVLVISVPKGRQPIYYKGNIPYVRHLTESRPAKPNEVLEIVSEYLNRISLEKNEDIDELRSEFYSELAGTIGDTLIYADQVNERNTNPWLDQWRSAFGNAAKELRDLAAQELAVEDELVKKLSDIANSLNEVATLRLTLSDGSELEKLVSIATQNLKSLKEEVIDSVELNKDFLIHLKNTVITIARKLLDLVDRSHDLVESGNIEELQENASELGYDLLRVTEYKIDDFGNGIKEKLIEVGRPLHLVETITIYMDGGLSMRAIEDRVRQSSKELDLIVENIEI